MQFTDKENEVWRYAWGTCPRWPSQYMLKAGFQRQSFGPALCWKLSNVPE